MSALKELSREELLKLKDELEAEFAKAKALNLKLDMSRGKPSVAQLPLGDDLFDAITKDSEFKSENGLDCRNYGVLDGIPEAKKLMAEIMGTDPSKVIVAGNSSLNLMYDSVSRSYTHGVMGSTPWCKLDKVKFLCPVPGYDRHFAVTEHFGIEMITVPLYEDGPDMDLVEKYVNNDETVKGIWCVPKYSNPCGYTYSEATCERFAALKPAAADFRIYWDNAYAVHDLYDEGDFLPDIISLCEKAGNPDIVYEFASTSKVSMAGSGIAALAASEGNLADIKKTLTIQTIGYDKINQLRHVYCYKNLDGIKAQMKKHAAILRPKFEAVLKSFENGLGGLEIGSWTTPKGGYFIAFTTMEGCAKEVVAKCKEAGVTLTGAGAPFPYKNDPLDSTIRIAPSFPSPEDMAKASDLFVLCVKLVSVNHLLSI